MIKEILLLAHSHTDRGYMHDPHITLPLHAGYLDQALSMAEAEPSEAPWRWTVETSAVAQYWWQEADENQRERLRQTVASGLIDVGAMAWHTTPLAGVTEWQRMLAPIQELRETVGVSGQVALQFDVNGIPWGAVPLFRAAGVEMLMMAINIDHGGFPGQRHEVFRWEGPDGQKLLVHNGDHYGTFERALRIRPQTTVAEMQEGWDAYAAQIRDQGHDRDWVLLTTTGQRVPDCCPPWPLVAAKVRAWNEAGSQPRIRFITPTQFLAHLRAEEASAAFPLRRGDFTDYWNAGCGATAMATTTSRRAKRLRSLARALRPAKADRWEAQLDQADDELTQYDEHTWGGCYLSPHPDRLLAWAGDHQNQALAASAFGRAHAALRTRLEAVAGNPADGYGVDALLLVNPDETARAVAPRVRQNWLDGTWYHNGIEVLVIDDELDHGIKPWTRLAPVEVPARSIIAVPVTAWDTTPAKNCGHEAERLWTPHHDVRWDAATGRITAWENGTGASPWLATGEAFPAAGLVLEQVATEGSPTDRRDAMHKSDYNRIHRNQTCWNPDWPAQRDVLAHLQEDAVTHDAAGLHWRRRWSLPHRSWAELMLHFSPVDPAVGITLRANLPHVQDPFGLYLTLPLALAAGWEARFDTLGATTRLDEDQLPGVSRDWVTVENCIHYTDTTQSITLHTPDAPLVMPNGFGYAQHRAAIPRTAHPLLLAWPVNNYWNTNFPASQPGYVEAGWWLEQGPAGARPAARTFPPDRALAHPCLHAPRQRRYTLDAG